MPTSDPPPRKWSFITPERWQSYLTDAARVVDFCRREQIPIFASAIAGVGFIREALSRMGGEPSWWVNLITSKSGDPFGEMWQRTPGPIGKQ